MIVGIDEVGRGPWAGPVVAAAVGFQAAFYENPIPENLQAVTDSKKLKPAQREELAQAIRTHPLVYYALGEASVAEIDAHNIRQATFLAMVRAAQNLKVSPTHALVDGRDVPPELPCTGEAIIKGDEKEFLIGCASIVAKVARDQMMAHLHKEAPHYGWDTNAGYGTKAHQEGLAAHGITPHHRKSFAPIKALC